MKKVPLIIAFAFLALFCAAQTTVKIGDQTWAAQNLDVVTFRNGDSLIEAKTDKEWKKAYKENKPAWCYYDNDPANGKKFGKMYNVHAIIDSRGLAPVGFHIPSNEEWDKLCETYGGWKKVGTNLKSSTEWDGDNSSGFNGTPSGIRYGNGPYGAGGAFAMKGEMCYFWSARRDAFMMKTKKPYLTKIPSSGGCYLSVRCIAD